MGNWEPILYPMVEKVHVSMLPRTIFVIHYRALHRVIFPEGHQWVLDPERETVGLDTVGRSKGIYEDMNP